MNRLRFVLLLVVSALMVAGCGSPLGNLLVGDVVRASGETEVREFDFAQFDKIEAGNTFEVVVRGGDVHRVVVEADVALLPHLDVGASGGTLRLRLADRVVTRGPITLRAEVTMPTVTRLYASGASDMNVENFAPVEFLDLHVSGASGFYAEIDASDLRLNASGSSNVSLVGAYAEAQLTISGASQARLRGTGERVQAGVSGSSELDLSEFPVAVADLNASGASSITADVTQRLDAQASGASSIRYDGAPAVRNQNASGASTIGQR